MRPPSRHRDALRLAIGDISWRRYQVFVAVALCYFLSAKFGVRFTVMPEGIAILWPPNSVLLAGLILGGSQAILPLALLTILAEIAADMPTFTLAESLLFGIVNVSEAVLAFVLLKRAGFDPRFASVADVPRFVLAGPVAAALAASALGAGVYTIFRGGETGYLEFVRLWWFGDAIGLLVFTPLILSFALGSPNAWESIKRTNGLDLLALAITAAAVGLFFESRDGIVFGMPFAPILLLPFVILVAARFEMRVVTATIALIALAVVVATTHGRAPFGAVPPLEAVMRAQEVLLVLSVVALGLAALLSQLRAQHEQAKSVSQQMTDLNRNLEARVRERTASLDAVITDLVRMAMIDPLTGLFNRRAFFQRAHGEFDRSRRHGEALAVLMVDIDHFKSINDRHGHQAGDRVLQQVARAIAAALRPEDMIARYGGEEFAVLAPGADLPGALILAARLQSELAQRMVAVDYQTVDITVSVGVASLTDGDDAVESVIKRADDALFAAKRGGRNRVMPAEAT